MSIIKKMSTYLYLYLFILVLYTLVGYIAYNNVSITIPKPFATMFGVGLHVFIIALTIKMISREVRDVTIRNILSASSVLFYAFFLIQTLSYKVYFIN